MVYKAASLTLQSNSSVYSFIVVEFQSELVNM